LTEADKEKAYKPIWLQDESMVCELPATVDSIATTTLSKDQILRNRSIAAAKRQSRGKVEETIEIVQFLLGTASYAFELTYLREVCPLTEVTYIPFSPTYIVGVINLRGLIVPIFDLMQFLDVGGDRITVFNKAVILQKGKLIVGFLADEVLGAVNVPVDQLQTALPGLGGLGSDYLKGVTKDRLVVVDAKKVLDDPRLNVDPNKSLDV
jgi:purine-binding chemotaxis protein CheW